MTESRLHLNQVMNTEGSRWSLPVTLTRFRNLKIEHTHQRAMIVVPKSPERHSLCPLASKEPAAGSRSSLSILKFRRRWGTLYLLTMVGCNSMNHKFPKSG